MIIAYKDMSTIIQIQTQQNRIDTGFSLLLHKLRTKITESVRNKRTATLC